MYTDPIEHWKEGDSNVSEEAQKQILEAINEYIESKKRGDKEAIKKAHNKAEDAREGNIYVTDEAKQDLR